MKFRYVANMATLYPKGVLWKSGSLDNLKPLD
jgi:hypothetical protein